MQTERQKEIIETALDLIYKKGIQGLTIKNLSEKIGITEPAIYRHFENKISILVAILDFFKNNTEQIFENELKNDDHAIDKIEHLFNRHFSNFSKMPSLVSVVFSEEIFINEPDLIKKIAEIMDKNDKILTEIITHGQKKNEIRNDIPAKHLSTIIMGSLRLFVKKWQFLESVNNLPSQGQELFDSIKLLIQK